VDEPYLILHVNRVASLTKVHGVRGGVGAVEAVVLLALELITRRKQVVFSSTGADRRLHCIDVAVEIADRIARGFERSRSGRTIDETPLGIDRLIGPPV